MGKAMKAAKAMKAMKAMKAKRVSKRMAKVIAFRGGKTGGATTLTKADLMKNKAKKMYASGIGKWTAAVQKARKALGTKGFVAVKKGSPLYKKAREFFC